MGTGSEGIRIVAIKGSVRPGNYTSKALALVTDEIESSHPVITLGRRPRNDEPTAPGNGARLVRGEGAA